MVASALIAGAGSYVVSEITPDTYQASAQLLVGPISGEDPDLRAAEAFAETYAEIAVTTQVLQAAASRANVSIDAADLAENTDARANDLTRILTITVTDDDAAAAAALANGLADELIQFSRQNAPSSVPAGQAAVGAGSLRVVEPAEPPPAPESAGAVLVVPLAALAGLAAAFMVAIGVEVIGDRVREPSDVEEIIGGPCIQIGVTRKRRFLWWGRPLPEAGASRFRIVTAALDARDEDAIGRSLSVVPAETDRSGPNAAIRVAEALSSAGHDVLLVDADQSRTLSHWLGLGGAAGLDQYLANFKHDPNALASVRLPTSIPRMSVIPAGTQERGLADPDRTVKALQDLLNRADRVVLSTGSPLVDGDSLVWARSTGAVMLVVTAGRTQRRKVGEAAQILRRAGGTVSVAVLIR